MSRLLCLFLLLSLTGALHAATMPAAANERLRGGTVEWARLQTRGAYWDRHANSDLVLLDFLRRNTTLNIGQTWRVAWVAKLDELCLYPFLYSDSIASLTADEGRNLAEYLRRGGFLFIDACRNKEINPDIKKYLQAQLKVLSAQFPNLRSEKILPNHEMYSIYFHMKQFPPFRRSDGQEALHGVFVGDRMVAVIGMNGFQCAWAGYSDRENANASAQMVTNIYLYAMSR